MTALLVLLGMSLSAPMSSYSPPSELFVPGERLRYKAYVFGWVPIGDVWFEASEDTYEGSSVYRFDGRAYGHYVIYTLDIRTTSFVDPWRLRSLAFQRRQLGTEKRLHQVLFDRAAYTATFHRKRGKFDSAEQMDRAPWVGGKPFPIDDTVNDILYTLYFARSMRPEVGAEGDFSFVEKRHIWNTRVSVVEEKQLELDPLGTFDAVRVVIEPDFDGREKKGKNFRGLFGVEGSLEVWVDKKTKLLLKAQGRVPVVYVLRPTVSIVLQEYTLGTEQFEDDATSTDSQVSLAPDAQ